MLTLKEVFHLSNRQTEGETLAVRVDADRLDCTRSQHAAAARQDRPAPVADTQAGAVAFGHGCSGLKVCGEGEWKARQCGWSRRRTWRKFHVAVDTESGEVQAAMLSMAGVADAEMVEPMLAQIDQPIASVAADGGYDKRRVYTALHARTPTTAIAIPPQHNARIWPHANTHAPPHSRDEVVRFIRVHGRKMWKAESGYHQRSRAETAMF